MKEILVAVVKIKITSPKDWTDAQVQKWLDNHYLEFLDRAEVFCRSQQREGIKITCEE